MPPPVYDPHYYANASREGLRTAKIVLPLAAAALGGPPRSVIDLGCGQGVWLAVADGLGVARLHGVDGPMLDQFRHPAASFQVADLQTQTDQITGRYELALCLNVVQYLSPESAPAFLAMLQRLSPRVLFAAAPASVTGDVQANPLDLAGWTGLFAGLGYRMTDPIRPSVAGDARVSHLVREHIVLFRNDLP